MPPEIPRLSATDARADIVSALDAHGAAIVEGLLDADTLARFDAELDPLLAAARPDRAFLNPAIEWFARRAARACGLLGRLSESPQ